MSLPVSTENLTPEAPRRRDTLPPWIAVLLLLFLLVRLYDVGVAPWLGSRPAHRTVARDDSGMDTDSMQDILQTDLQTKSAFLTAYLQAYAKPGGVVRPDPGALRQALKSAEQLQRESRNSPGAARRVMLLRSLLNLPPLVPAKNGLDPLAAFTTALPAGVAAADRARYNAEGRLWEQVFRGGRLTPNQVADFSAQIRRIPGIRWWVWPALIALNNAQGDLSEASRYTREASSHLLPTLLPAIALGLVRVGLILLGTLFLLYFLIKRLSKSSAPSDFWPTVPEAVPSAARRLGVGDLMGVFVVYLLAREVIGVLLTGFSGFGAPHVLRFGGLLTPFLPRLRALPASQESVIEVLLESAVYLLSALPPIVYLLALARSRGASLADEIGWNHRRWVTNVLYGFGGFAIASPLMILVATVAARLARQVHAPSPSNPVIPQLISAPSFWVQVILVLLATVAAPLVEELLFRGVFYNAVRMRFGPWPGIILTGLVFGFVHPVGIAEMLAIATLGGVFAWMAETRKSLVPSITAHFLNNMTSTLLLLFVLAG